MNIDNKTLYKWIRIAFTVMIVLVVVYGTISLSYRAYDFGYRVFTEPAMEELPGVSVEVTIEESMSPKQIGKLLEEEGLIRDADLFVVQYKLSAYSGEIIPGTYTLNTSLTAKEMMIIMADQVEEE